MMSFPGFEDSRGFDSNNFDEMIYSGGIREHSGRVQEAFGRILERFGKHTGGIREGLRLE
jgi:hypothetical protein